MSKNALKLRKKRESKKAKKEQTTLESSQSGPCQTSSINHHPAVIAMNGLVDSEITVDPEKLKKIKKVRSVSLYLIIINFKVQYNLIVLVDSIKNTEKVN